MKLTTRSLSVLGLTLLLAGVGAWAQGGATTVTPVKSYTGSVADVTKMQDVVSPITDQVTLSALWADWGIADPLPTVDFSKQLVVVSTTLSSLLRQNLTLDDKGNLTVHAISMTLETEEGFRYVIAVINRAGITSVNGVALPVPVTILRSASADMGSYTSRQFRTITDEKTWVALWGTKVAPVNVDFSKEEALFVAMGPAGVGDYSIAITGVTETPQRITATVTETTPGGPTAPGLTHPYAVAVIAKSDKPVYFADRLLGGTMAQIINPPIIVPIISTITVKDSLQKTADTAVIKDVAAWKELYDKEMPAGTALPDVNFGENMALVVFAGAAGPSDAVTIRSVIEVNGKLQVDFLTQSLPYDGPDVVTYPWAAAIVPRSDLPVTFRNETMVPT